VGQPSTAQAQGSGSATTDKKNTGKPACDDPVTSLVKNALAMGASAAASQLEDQALAKLSAMPGFDIRNSLAFKEAEAEGNIAQFLLMYDDLVRGGGGDTCNINGPADLAKAAKPAKDATQGAGASGNGNGARGAANPPVDGGGNRGRDLVLGLNDGDQVVKFASANTYGQLMQTAMGDSIPADAMQSMVVHAINDPGTTIHVLLDGLDGTNPNPMEKFWYSVDQGYTKGFVQDNYTNWEMSYLDRAVESGKRPASSIKFYITENGKLIEYPMPDWAFGVRMSYQGGSSPYRVP
jgi:hypothetical protein